MTSTNQAFWRRPEVDAALRVGFKAGESAAIVAARLNQQFRPAYPLTRNAIIGRWNRLGLCRGCDPRALKNRLVPGRPKKNRGKPLVPFAVRAFIPPTPAVYPNPPAATGDVARVASILDLEEHHCRFPVARDGFCGAEKVSGLPYCTEHVRRCYRVPDGKANPLGRGEIVRSILSGETAGNHRKPLETVGD